MMVWVSAAEVLEEKPDAPEYTAVTEWFPDPRAELVKVAWPPLSSATVPSDVPLSKNSTLPVGVDAFAAVTVAVKVTG